MAAYGFMTKEGRCGLNDKPDKHLSGMGRGAGMEQLTIFDIGIEEDNRPCRYKFHRYIGQKVCARNYGVCTVTKIDTYYTDIKSAKGELLVGTPTTIYPIRCANCEHYQMVNGLYKACCAYTISPNVKPDDVCEKWEEREDEE